jgi:hypothetical protein
MVGFKKRNLLFLELGHSHVNKEEYSICNLCYTYGYFNKERCAGIPTQYHDFKDVFEKRMLAYYWNTVCMIVQLNYKMEHNLYLDQYTICCK